MKQLILIAAILTISNACFAGIPNQHSPMINALSSVWKNQRVITPKQVVPPKQDKNDITMVYGGEDISRRFTIVPHTTIA